MSDEDVAIAEELRAASQWVDQLEGACGRLEQSLLGLAAALENLKRNLEKLL